MAFKMKAGKEGPMKKNFGIGKNLPDGRSTSSAFQKPTYDKAFENMERVPGKTRGSYNRKNSITGELYADGPQGLSKFKEQAKTYNAKKNKPAAKPVAKTTTKPTVKPKSSTLPTKNVLKNTITNATDLGKKIIKSSGITPGNVLGKLSDAIKPKAKDETKVKLKKNKLTGKTKVKTVEKIGDKVIKTKTTTDRKGNTKTKTKTRKRTAGKGKQKIAKALTKFASKLLK